MSLDTLPPMDNAEFDTLEALLDELRSREEEVPQWEFCEGAMAALLCTRRPVSAEEALPVVVGVGEDEGDLSFKDADQAALFKDLWTRRWNEVAASLAAKVESLDDERAFQPECLDLRGAIAALPPEERAEAPEAEIPSFGQVWALGFLAAVEQWSDDWAPPRDKDVAAMLADALEAIEVLASDDTAPPALSMYSEDGPPTVSQERLDDFGEAIWAVYDLRQLWKSMGPRVETVRKAPEPGRNDPCYCGSGKKYKKCHGA